MKMNRKLQVGGLIASLAAFLLGLGIMHQASGNPRFPICANGQIFYLPFPGNDEDNSPKDRGVCHAARLNDRVGASVMKPKAR